MSWAMVAEVLARRLPPHRFEHEYTLDNINEVLNERDCPYSIAHPSAVLFDEEIYVVGSNTEPYTQCLKYGIAEDLWQELAEVPADPRNGVTQQFGEDIYQFGGNDNASRDSVRRYSIAEDCWHELPTMPRGGGPAVKYQGQAYVLAATQLQKYDPDRNTWQVLAPCPYSLSSSGAMVVVGEELHVIGAAGSYTSHAKYSLEYDTWETLEELPTSAAGCSAVELNGEIYVVSGAELVSFRKYHPLTETWTILKDCPNNAQYSSAVVFDEEIYVFGGYQSPYTQVRKYNVQKGVWVELSAASYSLQSSAAVVVEDEIYIKGNGNVFRRYRPRDNSWTQLTEGPDTGRTPLIVTGDGILILNGATVHCYQIGDGTWESWSAPLGIYANHGVAAALDEHIYLGFQSKFSRYTPATGEWLSLPDCPQRTDSGAAVPLSGEIYLVGGSGGQKALHKFTPQLGTWTILRNNLNSMGRVAGVINGEIYVLSGTQAHKYTLGLNIWTEVGQAVSGSAGVAYGNSLFLFSGTNARRYTPYEMNGFHHKTLARVERGQRVFYETLHHTAVLMLNGAPLPYGETLIEASGYLIADPVTLNEDTIYGWID